jgi:hypothetical protein
VEEMINLVLSPKYNNYSVVKIPDFAHEDGFADGQRWVDEVKKLYGELNYFVSGNPWTNKLLESHYNIIHPASLVPKEQQLYCKGSIVRMALARNEEWEKLMKPEVAEYLMKKGLVERFRREFGLQTIATLTNHPDYEHQESIVEEREHPREKSDAVEIMKKSDDFLSSTLCYINTNTDETNVDEVKSL